MPRISRTMSGVTIAAVSQPMPMPTIAPGSMITSVRRSRKPRHDQSETMSIRTRIGSRIAAACTGGMASAISGTPTSAMAPPSPPLASPTRATAGIATA